jgi:hypothetical protein
MAITGKKYTFSKKNVDKAPNLPGVFGLYEGDVLIFIGQAKGGKLTIRTCLQLQEAGLDGSCPAKVTTYRREECPNPVIRQGELLKEYQEKHGKLPRFNGNVE